MHGGTRPDVDRGDRRHHRRSVRRAVVGPAPTLDGHRLARPEMAVAADHERPGGLRPDAGHGEDTDRGADAHLGCGTAVVGPEGGLLEQSLAVFAEDLDLPELA